LGDACSGDSGFNRIGALANSFYHGRLTNAPSTDAINGHRLRSCAMLAAIGGDGMIGGSRLSIMG
jgi:hypothetical protein